MLDVHEVLFDITMHYYVSKLISSKFYACLVDCIHLPRLEASLFVFIIFIIRCFHFVTQCVFRKDARGNGILFRKLPVFMQQSKLFESIFEVKKE